MSSSQATRADYLTRFQVQGRRKSAKTYGVRPWLEDAEVLEKMSAGERSDFLRQAISDAIAKAPAPTEEAGAEQADKD